MCEMERSDGARTKSCPADPAHHSGVFSLMSSTRSCVECGQPLALVQNSNARYCYECRAKRMHRQKLARAHKYYASHKKEVSEYQRERYQWLREKGFCVSCGQERAEVGYVRCPACNEKYREQYRKKKPVAANDGTRREKDYLRTV